MVPVAGMDCKGLTVSIIDTSAVAVAMLEWLAENGVHLGGDFID